MLYLKLILVVTNLLLPLTSLATTAEDLTKNCNLNAGQISTLTSFTTSSSTKPDISCENNTLTFSHPPLDHEQTYEISIPYSLFEEAHQFYGLAQYYNGSRIWQMHDAEVNYLDNTQHPDTNAWFGWKGRFNVFALSAPDAEIKITEQVIQLQWPAQVPLNLEMYLGYPDGQFSPLRYSYLWDWLAALCRGTEIFLQGLNAFVGNWGIAIIILSIVLKVIFLPLQWWVFKLQKEINRCQAILEPKFKEIKAKFDGEEAHQHLMAEYKQLGITPFYTLKPLIGPMILLPIQVAIFNVLGEMPELLGNSFLWIKDLAYPDTMFYLPFTIPFMGNEFNMLPILMTLMTIVCTITLNVPENTVSPWQKYRLYLLAATFLILFYPFPAAMVLFWTMMNLLQFIQQQIFKNYEVRNYSAVY